MSEKTIVLGAREGSGNIGEAVADALERGGYHVTTDDCQRGPQLYDPPSEGYLAEFGSMVVSLGQASARSIDIMSPVELDDIIEANLRLPLEAARRYVVGRGEAGGKVVFIGSYAHDHALTGCAPYCAAKAGLAAAVRELGWELTDAGYRFHIVHPYHVPSTPMGKNVVRGMVTERGMTYPQAEEYQRRDLKMPDHLRPQEIAEVVRWLLTEPAAEWLSGQGLSMYGGTR